LEHFRAWTCNIQTFGNPDVLSLILQPYTVHFMHLAVALSDLLYSYIIGSCTPWDLNPWPCSTVLMLVELLKSLFMNIHNVQSIFDASRLRSIAWPCLVIDLKCGLFEIIGR